MTSSKGTFFFSRRFFPLFTVQASGAFNDNLLKQSLGLFIIYNTVAFSNSVKVPLAGSGMEGGEAVMLSLAGFVFTVEQVLILSNVLFTIPFFLFSALAGQLADKFDKSLLIRAIKVFECLIMVIAATGFVLMNLWLLLLSLFLMGFHSSLFGPIKYSILPDHLEKDELVAGNGIVEGGTFLSILLGTLIAGPLVQVDGATAWVSLMLFIVAGFGVISAWRVPSAPIAEPELAIDWHIFRSTVGMVKYCATSPLVFISILGVSWFWVLGALYVTLFAPFAKEVLGGNQQLVSCFLAVFSIGIAIGSGLCSRALHGEISAKYVPFAAMVMTWCTWDLSYFANLVTPTGKELIGVVEFLGTPYGWRIIRDLGGIAIAGGFFVVPLYAIMQHHADSAHRARVVAGNNIINALSIVVGSALVMWLQNLGWGTTGIYALFGLLNICMIAVIGRLIPRNVLGAALRRVFQVVLRVEIVGVDRWVKATSAGPVVAIANHVSTLDPLILPLFLPGAPVVGITVHHGSVRRRRDWVLMWLIRNLVNYTLIDGDNPFTVKGVVQAVKNGRPVILFPEGRATATGAVMKVSEVPIFVARKTQAVLVPLHVDGSQYSHFSFLKGRVRRRLFPKITITVCPEMPVDERDDSASRVVLARKVYDVLTSMSLTTKANKKTIFGMLVEAASIHGYSKDILEDSSRKVFTYRGVLLSSLALSSVFARKFSGEKVIGVLLPNCSAHVFALFGLSLANIVPAELNFTAGLRHVLASCKVANLRKIITVRALWDDESCASLRKALPNHVDVFFLDDINKECRLWDRLKSLVMLPIVLSGPATTSLVWKLMGRETQKPEDVGVILFTSGSEGSPKGVALSHRALVSNFMQLDARVDFSPSDRVFNALPLFHSFGLSVGTLLPLFSGMRCFLYPSPLHYKKIADLVYETEATLLFGTDTFLRGYARVAHSYDFFRVQYVFAGAEKLSETTRQMWFERFGLRIFEGYGATETAPVLSMNTRMFYKGGSVGRVLPGIEYRLRVVEGIQEGGVLEVRGPNVMIGYLRPTAPGVIEPLTDGWYDTGDVVTIDDEGFLWIVGRARRFAKVAGEMVSLLTVERVIEDASADARCAIVVRRHPTRGEELVLYTDSEGLTKADVQGWIRESGLSPSWAPRDVRCITSIPLLPSGKVNYALLEEALLEESGSRESESSLSS